jgi:hypothetical protein
MAAVLVAFLASSPEEAEHIAASIREAGTLTFDGLHGRTEVYIGNVTVTAD